MQVEIRARYVLAAAAIAVLATAGRADAQSQSDALSALQTAVACGPSPALVAPQSGGLRVVGAQDTSPRALFGPRDLVVLSGGTQSGVQLGQEYFIRRAFAFGVYPGKRPRSVQTTGWLRIVAVNDMTAIGLIDVACDGVIAGDYLDPFVTPAASVESQRVDTVGDLDFTSLGRVIFGSRERRIGATGDFMLIDRGSAQGVAPGTRFAVYRDLRSPGVPLAVIGEGVIVSTADTTSLMRITSMRSAVESGDYVVPRK